MGDPDEYFVTVAARPRPAPAEVLDLALAAGSGRHMARLHAVLVALAGVVCGVGVPVLFRLVSMMMFSNWTRSDTIFAALFGVVIAVGGIASAGLIWATWRRRPGLHVGEAGATLRYPGFAAPLAVPRDLVRAVSVDSTPVRLFHPNHRFPITGALPAESFADALDVAPGDPWAPRDPADRPRTFPIPPPPGPPRTGHLFGPDGASLPVLRVNPEDVPNLAVLFHEPVRTPRPPLGLLVGGCTAVFAGSRRIHGMLLRVADPEAAMAAFAGWGVLRGFTADDVLDEGLLVPAPLRGWRTMVYAAVLFTPLLLRVLLRRHL